MLWTDPEPSSSAVWSAHVALWCYKVPDFDCISESFCASSCEAARLSAMHITFPIKNRCCVCTILSSKASAPLHPFCSLLQMPHNILVLLMQETNIAWASDKNSLYGHYRPTNFNTIAQYRGGGTINSTNGYVNDDEHFLVWMRPGAARTVRKLYARINSDIPAGTAAAHQAASSHQQL